jgi:transposase
VSAPTADLAKLACAVAKARGHFGMPASARVVSCYKAGRDGFWLHRHLRSVGIENQVVDAASIEVSRRLRHVKTDWLDGERLLAKLIRHHTGERDGWSVVRAPSLEEEDARRLHRELERLKRERLAHRERLREPKTDAERSIVQLMSLGAIGPISAWLLVMEFFGWRRFRNRREVAALAGLVGTPYNSGDSERDQGISKAGNRRVRAMMVEIAWLWLRFQPNGALSQWYQRRFAGGGLRTRRIGIVALARRLLIALWRYLADGVIPEDARLIASEI